MKYSELQRLLVIDLQVYYRKQSNDDSELMLEYDPEQIDHGLIHLNEE
jgi:hypothetical protein